MGERASGSRDAVERVVDGGRRRVENGAVIGPITPFESRTNQRADVALDAHDGIDPAQGLRVKRFGARLHLLVEVPSIRRAVFILRADFTAMRKWIIRAWSRSIRGD
jgi:hypothetical protein